MDPLLRQTLGVIEEVFEHLCTRVPPPKFVELPGGPAFRYTEESIHQAIIQKLARIVSGLNAINILFEAGYVQEVGAMQRILDELQEDVQFLALGIIYNDISELHQRYLKAFYLEEFDEDYEKGNKIAREMVPRKKIRAYCANSQAGGPDPSTGLKAGKAVSSVYSGYIHAASPHVMDMYGGNPPKFHVHGMLGTPRMQAHEEDLWNYFYRGILASAFAAKAFGDTQLFERLRKYRDQFEEHWKKKEG